jgi:nitrate reductase gamma subunit
MVREKAQIITALAAVIAVLVILVIIGVLILLWRRHLKKKT